MADDVQQPPTGHKNEKVGQVVSTKMAKTIVVEVTRRVTHPLYRRILTKHKKFYAHDENATAQMGDMVRIIECRPLSKLKHWQLGDVLRKATQVEGDTASAPDPVASAPGGKLSASKRLAQQKSKKKK